MDIQVCVGSACHLRGSYKVLEAFQALVEQNDLTDKVNVRPVLCLGRCGEGSVSVKIDDQDVSVSPENVSNVFNEMVLGRI